MNGNSDTYINQFVQILLTMINNKQSDDGEVTQNIMMDTKLQKANITMNSFHALW